MSSWKYYFYRRPIGEPLENNMPESEIHRRLTINMSNRRPIESNIPDWRPFGDQYSWLETIRRPTFLIRDHSETNFPDWRPFGDQYSWLETIRRPTCLIIDLTHFQYDNCRHKLNKDRYIWLNVFKLWLNSTCMSASDGSPQACQYLTGLRSDMSVSRSLNLICLR